MIRIRWPGPVACMEGRGIHIGFFGGKPEGKRILRRPRCRWESIEMHLG
jgi:hypothetical protein